MLSKLKKLILTSYFTSAVLALIVISFLPKSFHSYEIRLVESGQFSAFNNPMVYVSDMDNDGNSEKIISYNDHEQHHSIQIIKQDGGIIDQWNCPGELSKYSAQRLITGDVDNDRLNEVYLQYKIEDTLFLKVIEPLDSLSPIYIEQKKIALLDHSYAPSDCGIKEMYFKDINNDGHGEIIMKITAGRAKFPRGIYVYDVIKDTIYRSPVYGNNLTDLQILDLDGDGFCEIFGSSAAAGNVSDTLGIPYHDYSAWLMVYDHNLNLKFPPIEYPGFRSCLTMAPIYDSLIVVYYHHNGATKNYPEFLLINANGEVLKKKTLNEGLKNNQSFIPIESNGNYTFWVFNYNNIIKSYTEDFIPCGTLELNESVGGADKVDLDGDGVDELIMKADSKTFLIAKNNFQHIVEYTVPDGATTLNYCILQRKNSNNLIHLQHHKTFYNLAFIKNPLASFEYLIYLAVFLALWGFILIIRKIQAIQIQKKENIRKQIVDLQLKSFRNQMDPHFTFNVFNTLAHRIQKSSPDNYDAFMSFSRLIRSTLESSDKITRSIQDEIAHLKSYLELEKLRYEDRLHFEIRISDAIDQQHRIPKMTLQTYVENAIKHGIRHKESSGKVLISVGLVKKDIVFEIEDDGVGREKAKELSTDSTGFGLQIMNNYFQLFNAYNESKIQHEITDLFNEQQCACGTKVRILIPLNFSYKLNRNRGG